MQIQAPPSRPPTLETLECRWFDSQGSWIFKSPLDGLDAGWSFKIYHVVSENYTEAEMYLVSTFRMGEGNGTPLQYSCLENPLDREAWWAAVHGVAKSPWGRLYFHFSLSCIGDGNGTHSSVLAWRISGTGEPGGLPSMGSQSWTLLKWLSSSSTLWIPVLKGNMLVVFLSYWTFCFCI